MEEGIFSKLWFDPWLSCKPLAESSTSLLVLNSDLGFDVMVSSIICNFTWQFSPSNHYVVMEFWRSFDTSKSCNSDISDTILWDAIQA